MLRIISSRQLPLQSTLLAPVSARHVARSRKLSCIREKCDTIDMYVNAWRWLNGWGGGLRIPGSWVQIPLSCWINTRWGWLCLSSFRGRQNECQHAGIVYRSRDPSRIVPNSQGDCLVSTNALHRVWSQWMDGWSWVLAPLAAELTRGEVDSACHPSEVSNMSARMLVYCVGVATRPGLCPIAKETA